MKWFKELSSLYKAIIIVTVVFIFLIVGLIVVSKMSKEKSDSSSEDVKTPSSSVSSTDSSSNEDSSSEGSSSDDTSSSDDSSKSSSDIKVSEKTIGRVEESSTTETITYDLKMENNTDNDVVLSKIVLKSDEEGEENFKAKTVDISNITLADFCKKTGLEDSKLPKKTFKSKGFIFEGKNYVYYSDKEKTSFGSTLLVETDDKNKVKGVCITKDLQNNDFALYSLGNVKIGDSRENAEKKIGRGTYKVVNGNSILFYKNDKCSLIFVCDSDEDDGSSEIITEIFIIRNG